MSACELRLSASLPARLAALSLQAAPLEACGLLLGRPARPGTPAEVLDLHPTRNCAPRPTHQFELHPEDHLAAHLRARALRLVVLGTWHSHPGGEPHPSPADRAGALESAWSLIVATSAVGRTRLSAWLGSGTQMRLARLKLAPLAAPTRAPARPAT